ncbi:hypothetical protein AMJ44_03895 [candidate division WOR-1 bacterium DG_54_3]|uniref:Hydantoinase n=1 Tax=candidate division WOR-1 bacterium DG_54_3 TaxID=1703775 RepID=A0A0S7Y5I5_UNCSA|nr:MAG: hypothetical protein AMJ44_03895 [candidate division WOR-1 bacterium DG_54_3]
MSKVRIGIDVGGTFTHAVAVSSNTLEIIGESKVLTTHSSPQGVAQGIIESLENLLKKCSFSPQDVTYIAHSTTQATNSLLEGDVSNVGIIGMGKGIEKFRAERETCIPSIELAKEKFLITSYRFLDITKGIDLHKGRKLLNDLIQDGCSAAVFSQAFSPDDPTFENALKNVATELKIPAVAGHEISGLYGLKVRTRTAAINASILPMMMNVAQNTEESIKAADISAPLMVMRSDGGVISMPEVKRRPIQTILSGPAAGVAGALLYSKVSDGIFIDVGGTSTDISVIKDGRAKIKTAEIGGHKLYLKTLDVRTAGLAGGSMVRVKGKEIIDVGPRSAHIAGFPYSAFSTSEDMKGLEIYSLKPKASDPKDYVAVKSSTGKSFAITVTCAANALNKVKQGDYAFGNRESARKALEPLARMLDKSIDQVAEKILDLGSKKLILEIDKLIKDYNLDRENIVLIGGGGGAGALVPYIAKKMGLEGVVAPNHAVISAIGVAMSLVHDVVERMVVAPKENDILEIRQLAQESVIGMGALPESIEVKIEIEAKKNIIRASATGATELRLKDKNAEVSQENKKAVAAKSMKTSVESVKLLGSTDFFDVFASEIKEKSFFGLIETKRNPVRVIDREGIVRLARGDAAILLTRVEEALKDLETLVKKYSTYGDAGEKLPHIFVLCRSRLLDLSGIPDFVEMATIARVELEKFKRDMPVILISTTF